jgi:FecR-like protein
MRLVHQISKLLVAAFVLTTASTAFAADDGAWTVSKSSGEVWLTSSGAQPASLRQEELLKPGDTVRTGRNGRVLLRRGEETMLISPNSVVGMPTESKEGLSTTIVQQAGSVLLEVEKRNVKHFEVETPYLAAVVKGTQFRVTINAGSTSVDVIRGQVEVADFRSGQIAQVMPGQHATTFTEGKVGLSLSGSGTFNPIEQGKPRAPGVERIHVPRGGLSAPTNAANGTGTQPSRQAGMNSAKPGVTRISSSMGEVRLNFHRVTHGLARDASSGRGRSRNAANTNTIWGASASTTNSAIAGTGQNSTGNSVASTAAGTATGTSTAAASSVVTVAAGSGSGTGNGNSNSNSNDDNNNNGNGRHRGWGNGRDFWNRFNNRFGNGNGRNH